MKKVGLFPARLGSRALVAAVAAAALPAAAQMSSQNFAGPYDPTISVTLGGVVNRFDTSVRLDGQTQRGTDFALEDNGLDSSSSSFTAGLTWRIAQRHRVDFNYFESKRSGERTYSNEIDIGDSTFPLGATVGIQAKDQFFFADYRYSLIQDPTFELAALFGIYGGKFTFDINAVGNAGNSSNTYNKSVSTGLPLPLIGLTADWYPDRQWHMAAQFEGLKAKVGDVDGHAYVAGAALEYMFTRGWGMGARYDYTEIKADVTKGDFNGNFAWKTSAVSLYAKLVF
ncbi:MAG TPA: hypothetical protein VFU92_01500 [Usitatibacter sp.]|nr:hypothetical protein [Usitatibacter sp.]